MFEVVLDIEDCFYMDESFFYDECGRLSIESVADVEKDEAKRLIKERMDALKSYGATVEDEQYGPLTVSYVVFSDDFKRNFFKARFERAKALMAAMQLDEFAGVSKINENLFGLEECISNDYSDCAFLNEMVYPMDEFLRHATPGKKYYFGSVVLMR